MKRMVFFSERATLPLCFLMLHAANVYGLADSDKEKSLQKKPAMEIFEYKPYLMQKTIFDTERVFYEVLKKNPLDKPVLYAAIPWTAFVTQIMIDVRQKKMNCSISDALVKELKNVHIAHPHCFTVYPGGDLPALIPAMKHIGIKYVFWPHATPGQKMSDITLFPILHLSSNFSPPAQKKDILYSFIGCANNYGKKHVREEILALPRYKDSFIKERKQYHSLLKQSSEQLSLAENEYKGIIARSRFGLCPRGTSPATYRLWECMGAGAIPVILCDNLPLPPGINWDDFLLHVRESDVSQVDKIIRATSPEQEERMRQAALRTYAFLKNDPAYFIRYCFEHFVFLGE